MHFKSFNTTKGQIPDQVNYCHTFFMALGKKVITSGKETCIIFIDSKRLWNKRGNLFHVPPHSSFFFFFFF